MHLALSCTQFYLSLQPTCDIIMSDADENSFDLEGIGASLSCLSDCDSENENSFEMSSKEDSGSHESSD